MIEAGKRRINNLRSDSAMQGWIQTTWSTAQEYYWLVFLYILSSCIQAFPMASFGALLVQDLKCSAAELSVYYSSIFIPWNFRSVYGFVSDHFPILGYRRRPYICVSYFCVAGCYVLYSQYVSNFSAAVGVGVTINVFFAFSEAVLDGIAIEQISARFPDCTDDVRIQASNNLQSAAMASRTLGSMVSLGLVSAVPSSPREVILLSAIFPTISGVFCLIFNKIEIKLCSFKISKLAFPNLTNSRDMIRQMVLPLILIFVYSICPKSDSVLYEYLYLNFDLNSINLLNLFTILGSLIGTLVYWFVCLKIRNISILFSISTLFTIFVLFFRYFILFENLNLNLIILIEFFVSIFSRINLMPIQVIGSVLASGNKDKEAFVFGLITSIENWGGTIGGLIGAGLIGLLNNNLEFLIISNLSQLIPLLFLLIFRIRVSSNTAVNSSSV
jgi:hypothetical protein